MRRLIAHITLEAETPLKVGSNASDFMQDSPIQKDWNGLPMILGTSIAGVLRRNFKGEVDDVFGQDNGSKVIISNALLVVDKEGKVCEELLLEKTDFLQIFETLPIREHTAITDKGVAKDHSKFDEEVLYKGTRFKFSLEYIEDDKETFASILDLLSSSSFRLGSGSTKGFGKCKIIEIRIGTHALDSYSSSLNISLADTYEPNPMISDHTVYRLVLRADDFFMFGSGFGDEEADMTPVYEKVVDYEKGMLSEEMILIPASSIKGALSHRTAFHYNKTMLDVGKDHTFIGEKNDAVKAIFGLAKNSKEKIDGAKGKVLFSDCFQSRVQTKVFDHVSIDRFTGGAIDGALFQERTISDEREYEIEILMGNSVGQSEDGDLYIDAFEAALKDVTTGMLSLGGATTKGHGIFTGILMKNGVQL